MSYSIFSDSFEFPCYASTAIGNIYLILVNLCFHTYASIISFCAIINKNHQSSLRQTGQIRRSTRNPVPLCEDGVHQVSLKLSGVMLCKDPWWARTFKYLTRKVPWLKCWVCFWIIKTVLPRLTLNMTSKVDPRTKWVNIFLMAVDS